MSSMQNGDASGMQNGDTSGTSNTNALTHLWALVVGVNIKTLVPTTLDLRSGNYSKWCNLFQVAVDRFALEDHITAADNSVDPAWKRLDRTVLSWIYGSISSEILDIVMEKTITAYACWIRIEQLYRDNKKTRALYLDSEFHNFMQGDRSVSDYCLKLKTLVDTLRDVDVDITDENLVLTTLKGLNRKFDNVAMLVSMLPNFPSFIQLRSMLQLQENKNAQYDNDSSTATTLYSNNRGASYGGSTPTWRHTSPNGQGHHGQGGNYGQSYGGHSGYNGGKNKGKGKTKNKGRGRGNQYNPSPPTTYNPWTGAIQLWPMSGHSPAGLLGARLTAPRHGAPHGGAPQGFMVAAPQAQLQYVAPPTPLQYASLMHQS